MKLPTLPLASCLLLLLAGCAVPPNAPAKIDPPPVALVTQCARPGDIPEGATGQDLAVWTVDWIGAYGCERAKRQALIEAWPR